MIRTCFVFICMNGSLFAYSRFAYFRSKSGVSPTRKKIYIWHQSNILKLVCTMTVFVCTRNWSSLCRSMMCWYSQRMWNQVAAPQLPRIQEFIRYIEDTWLVGNYPLIMWNVYRSDGFQTNNHLKGWHNCLKRLVGKAHPNIYEFVKVIQKEQTATEVFVLLLEAGALPPWRALKAINRDQKIQELKELWY